MTILFDPRDDQAHVQRKSNDRQLIQVAIASATSEVLCVLFQRVTPMLVSCTCMSLKKLYICDLTYRPWATAQAIKPAHGETLIHLHY